MKALRNLVTTVILAPLAVLPFLLSPASAESFREPKLLALKFLTYVSVALAAALTLAGGRLDLRRARTVFAFAVAAALWSGVAALASGYPAARVVPVETVVVFAIFSVLTAAAAWQHDWRVLLVPLSAGALSSLVALAETLTAWRPYASGIETYAGANAFFGNPNDMAMALLPAVAMAVGLVSVPSSITRRVIAIGLLVILLVGVIASESVTALGAVVCTLAAAILATRRWWAVVAAGGAFLIALIWSPIASRLADLHGFFEAGNFDRLVSYRLGPFATAVAMAIDRPLFGVGPGAFGSAYFIYRERVVSWSPELRLDPDLNQLVFSETHNDFLQVLAETGLPGLVILIGALGFVGRVAFGIPRDDRSRIARAIAGPLVTSFAVLALAQFPLFTPVSATVYLFGAALCLVWSRSGLPDSQQDSPGE